LSFSSSPSTPSNTEGREGTLKGKGGGKRRENGKGGKTGKSIPRSGLHSFLSRETGLQERGGGDTGREREKGRKRGVTKTQQLIF